jgi:hypothetical protein
MHDEADDVSLGALIIHKPGDTVATSMQPHQELLTATLFHPLYITI